MNTATNPYINFKEGMIFPQTWVGVFNINKSEISNPDLRVIIIPWQRIPVDYVIVKDIPGLDSEHFRVDLKLTSCNVEEQKFVFEPISEFVKLDKPKRIELEENGEQYKDIIDLE